MNNEFINSHDIIKLFELLNSKSIEYLLLRNLDNELPNRLLKTKDIDILVNPSHKDLICTTLEKKGWINIMHPWDFGNNFKFLYSMDRFLMFKKNEIHLDICFQLSCRSLNAGEWFPLDEEIQISSFTNKIKVNNIWRFQLSFEDEIIHLLTRSIFDKKQFTQAYIVRIKHLFEFANLDVLENKLKKVFFKFSPHIITHIQNSNYESIRTDFLTFKDY